MNLYEPTTDELETKMFQDRCYRIYRDLKANYENGLKDFWKNPNCTPYQQATNLGTNGEKVIDLLTSLRAAVLAVNPSATLTSPTAYGTLQVEPDGTITILTVTP